jgi:hypothetical protein
MKTLRAVFIIVICAVAIAWVGNSLVSLNTQASSNRGVRAMSSAHDESHHHRHHGTRANRGIDELLGSSVLFGSVAAAVIIPSVIVGHKKRARR